MPKALNFDEVLNVIKMNDCEYISGEYKNTKSKLLLRCSCGNTFKQDIGHLKRGQNKCVDCISKHRSELCRTPFEEILKSISEQGCEYISGEYINGNSKLKIKCSCGNIFERDMHHFLSGQIHCSECANRITSEAKRRYTADDAYNILKEYGYKMIDRDEFTWAYNPVKCICKNGHETNIILSQLLCGKSGCEQCAIEDRKGCNSSLFIDGRSKISESLRQSIYSWREERRQAYGYTCPITGNKEITIHHLLSFDKIFYLITDKYNEDVMLNGHISDFSSYEIYNQIKNDFIKAHVPEIGIAISKEIHYKFHSRYGNGNNTPEQFDEFLRRFYNTSLSEIMIA